MCWCRDLRSGRSQIKRALRLGAYARRTLSVKSSWSPRITSRSLGPGRAGCRPGANDRLMEGILGSMRSVHENSRTTVETPLFVALAIAIGFANALSLIGWRQLDPTNLRWLKIDPALYQAGWEFLRHEPWHVPLTWLDRLNYPFGVSAAYLDVIPLVAIPLKVLSPLLPANFQYLGLYALLCLVLQTYFALRLMTRFTRDWVLIVAGALFFADSPILLSRLYGH